MKWNGPHDEAFFRLIEQYLDETIAKFVVQNKGPHRKTTDSGSNSKPDVHTFPAV